MITGNIISLSTGQSLYDLYGDKGCFVFWSGIILFVNISFVGSITMSLFRWICIIHFDTALVLGKERVKHIVHCFERTIYILIAPFLALAYIYGTTPLAKTFCYNKSRTFLRVMAKHEHSTDVGHQALAIFMGFTQSLGILEFLLYIFLFKKLWSHDQKMASTLPQKQIKTRNKNNIITLSGQAWAFMIEAVTGAIIQLTVNLEFDSVFLQPQIGSFYFVIMATAVSIGQFLTSPDLRRFYWES